MKILILTLFIYLYTCQTIYNQSFTINSVDSLLIATSNTAVDAVNLAGWKTGPNWPPTVAVSTNRGPERSLGGSLIWYNTINTSVSATMMLSLDLSGFNISTDRIVLEFWVFEEHGNALDSIQVQGNGSVVLVALLNGTSFPDKVWRKANLDISTPLKNSNQIFSNPTNIFFTSAALIGNIQAYNCIDDVSVFKIIANDLSVDFLWNSFRLNHSLPTFLVDISNVGTDVFTANKAILSYSLDNGLWTNSTIPSSISAGSTIQRPLFVNFANLAVGMHNITVKVIYSLDGNSGNDQKMASFQVFPNPRLIATFIENFATLSMLNPFNLTGIRRVFGFAGKYNEFDYDGFGLNSMAQISNGNLNVRLDPKNICVQCAPLQTTNIYFWFNLAGYSLSDDIFNINFKGRINVLGNFSLAANNSVFLTDNGGLNWYKIYNLNMSTPIFDVLQNLNVLLNANNLNFTSQMGLAFQNTLDYFDMDGVQWQSVSVIKIPKDLAIISIVSPITHYRGAQNQILVQFMLKNCGNTPFSNVIVPIRFLSTMLTIQENFMVNLTAGASAMYTFVAKVNFTIGSYIFTIQQLYPDDNPSNDVMLITIVVLDNPITSLPYFNGFETLTDTLETNLFGTVYGLSGDPEFDFNANDPTVRFRSKLSLIPPRNGSNFVTIDLYTPGGPFMANLLLNLNLMNYNISQNNTEYWISFYVWSHGEILDPNGDALYFSVDGIIFFKVGDYPPLMPGVWNLVQFNLGHAVKNAGKNFTSTFVLSFSVFTIDSALSANGTAGLSFDDISIFTTTSYDVGCINVFPIGGRRFGSLGGSTSFNATTTIQLKIQNFGGFTLTNVPYNYSINGIQSGQLIVPVLAPYETLIVVGSVTFDLSLIGNYAIQCSTSLVGDSNPPNDQFMTTITNYDVFVPTLPFLVNFESLPNEILTSSVVGLSTQLFYFDYLAINDSSRLMTRSVASSGNASILLDSSIANSTSTNYLYLYLDMSQFNKLVDYIVLDFDFYSFGDLSRDASDVVAVRGCANGTFVPILDLYNLGNSNNGTLNVWLPQRNIDISGAILDNFCQSFTLRFGQSGKNSYNTPNFPEGYVFDNIQIRKGLNIDVGITAIISPISSGRVGHSTALLSNQLI